jgi:hypothetical protein
MEIKMKHAAETVAWFVLGRDRDDWKVPSYTPSDPKVVLIWLRAKILLYR